MPDKNGYSVLNEYNNDFACIYSKLFRKYGEIVNYAANLFNAKLKEPLQKISDKIDRDEDISTDLDDLYKLVEAKFGKTASLKMPERKYSYYDEATLYINGDKSKEVRRRKYDSETFEVVAKGHFEMIDKELGYSFDMDYCVQDACIYYLSMVYDLWGKLQDEIRFYRSVGNRTFGEFLTSMTFGFISSVTRSFNTYDSTADAYAKFCSVYLLPDYSLLFGENGMCSKFNKALKQIQQLKTEYKNKANLIGKHNNKIMFEIDGLSQTLTLGEIYLKDYKELEDAFNRNSFGIQINYTTIQDKMKYMAPSNSFIFKSKKPFTFKKDSTLLTLIGFEAIDTKSWECDGEHIIFSRRNTAHTTDLEILRKIQISKDSKYFRDSITNIGALLKN